MIEKEVTITGSFKASALVCEFFGSCMISYCAGMALVNAPNVASIRSASPHIAHGFATGLVYMFGKEISGAYFNPAVTLAMVLNNAISWLTFFLYFGVQVAGSIFGALVMFWLRASSSKKYNMSDSVPTPNTDYKFLQVWGIETTVSFLVVLTYLVLSSFPKDKTPVAAAGIAIAVMISSSATVYGTGAGVNPVRVIGVSLVFNEFTQRYAWLYYLGPLLGSILAVLFVRYGIQDNSLVKELFSDTWDKLNFGKYLIGSDQPDPEREKEAKKPLEVKKQDDAPFQVKVTDTDIATPLQD